MSLNRVQLIGRLGADPELHTFGETYEPLCAFTVATNEYSKAKTHTEWHNVVVFGRSATSAQRHLKKGSRVFVEGKLRTQNYQTKEGHSQKNLKILASRVVFLDATSEKNAELLQVTQVTDPE